MAFDEHGNEMRGSETPPIVDKLAPCLAMRSRRNALRIKAIDPSEPFTTAVSESVERQMFVDALEYVEVYSEDVFARIMAREALGKRRLS